LVVDPDLPDLGDGEYRGCGAHDKNELIHDFD
jgi:hypothetical protein